LSENRLYHSYEKPRQSVFVNHRGNAKTLLSLQNNEKRWTEQKECFA